MGHQTQRHDGLDALIQGARAERRREDAGRSGSGLSDGIRNEIRLAMRRPSRLAELRPLFTPLSHWAYAAGIPACTVAVMAGFFALSSPESVLVADRGAIGGPIDVTKRDGQVIFLNADGTVQQVYKSSDPRDFSAAESLDQADGAFVDSLQSNGTIVFYRID